ncbi:amidophosphoribosyltransferase [Pavlovales sp. CCMP2436]|nr:amidophosphoribosyltransferase [Pavlovales sp. CCMP2436]
MIFDALTVLQHRGQDAAGMVTCQGKRLHLRKDNGLVQQVFTQESMLQLRGSMGIGHCRYPTAGTSSCAEAQPLYTNFPYGLCISHNGNLTNASTLKGNVEGMCRHVNTDSDSELLLNIFSEALAKVRAENGDDLDSDAIFYACSSAFKKCIGGYAVALLINDVGVVVFRDPLGIRPLIFGMREQGSGLADFAISSESVVIDTITCASGDNFEIVRDVAPGEAIFFPKGGRPPITRQCVPSARLCPCLFEYVYFARPDSVIDGVPVYEARLQMGMKLAERIKLLYPDSWQEIDVVVPVPDTARTSALSLAEALDRPYREGFIKNRYIARTFIMPGQAARKKGVRVKLNTIKCEFKGKNVLLVDDSIVRGTTSKEIVQMARDAGAANVFFCSAAPPVRFPNVYGIDIPTRTELIANGREELQIARMIDVDWLVYQDLQDLKTAVQEINPALTGCTFEASVFDGKYVTGDIGDEYFASQARRKQEKKEEALAAKLSNSVTFLGADGGGNQNACNVRVAGTRPSASAQQQSAECDSLFNKTSGYSVKSNPVDNLAPSVN